MPDKVTLRLGLVLVEKLQQVEADNLQLVRQYIKEIKDLLEALP